MTTSSSCAFCNQPMPEPPPPVRMCCDDGREFDRYRTRREDPPPVQHSLFDPPGAPRK